MHKYFSFILSIVFFAEISSLDATNSFELEKHTSTAYTLTPIGKDDRVPCDDPRVGRIMPLGCTAWLISSGCVLTAGHCAYDKDHMDWLEFNVPLSNLDGSPKLSNEEDRYPIIKESIVYSYYDYEDCLGDDWAIFRIGKNYRNESAFMRQGQFFRIIDNWNFIGSNPIVRVTGYGVDGPPPLYGYGNNLKNERSQTEQTDYGELKREETIPPKNIIYYEVDTLNANSGSPVYLPGTHLAVGIHTVGFSPNEEHLNKGTGFKNSKLIDALEDYPLPGKYLIYVDADFFAFSEEDGTIFKPYKRLEDAIDKAKTRDNFVGIIAGHYAHPGITFPKGKRITLKALAGNVRIGSAKYK